MGHLQAFLKSGKFGDFLLGVNILSSTGPIGPPASSSDSKSSSVVENKNKESLSHVVDWAVAQNPQVKAWNFYLMVLVKLKKLPVSIKTLLEMKNLIENINEDSNEKPAIKNQLLQQCKKYQLELEEKFLKEILSKQRIKISNGIPDENTVNTIFEDHAKMFHNWANSYVFHDIPGEAEKLQEKRRELIDTVKNFGAKFFEDSQQTDHFCNDFIYLHELKKLLKPDINGDDGFINNLSHLLFRPESDFDSSSSDSESSSWSLSESSSSSDSESDDK